MAKKAVVDVVVNKDDALKSIADVGRELDNLERKGSGYWSKFYGGLDKETRKAIDGVNDNIKSSMKSAILGQLTGLASAVSDPARTSWGGALAAANEYRRGVQAIATSTGQEFEAVSGKVNAVALRAGELPKTVMAWGSSLRGVSKDWTTAAESITAYKDRALQLNVPLESLQGTAKNLAGAFGIQSTAQVDKFFGTLDAYAIRSGVQAGRLQSQWATFGEAFGRLTSGDPTKFQAITAAFAGSSSDPEQAKRNQGFGMGLLNQSPRQLEGRMRRAGMLKRGEFLTDKNGEISAEKYAAAMRFLQQDVLKYYGSKDRAIEVQAGDDLEARRAIAGFLNTDFSGTKGAAPMAMPRTALAGYQRTGAGGREVGDVTKQGRDVALGLGALPAQDFAVAHGGGGRGLMVDAAGNVIGTAVNGFGGIALGAAGGALASKGGAALTALRGASALNVAGALGAGASVASAGMIGYGIGTGLDMIPLNSRQTTAGQKGETASDLMSRKMFEFLHPESVTTPMESPTPARAQQQGPIEVDMGQGVRGIIDGFGGLLRNTVLRVMPVDATGAPEGQPNL